ncbi:type I polyketide synthase [Aspergillus affinis]|uniref:type I polyketide synthase n=1 Tax=Aspergillus affinis TaxID=1070780 RepID=UPI0022FF3098|nr:polyketide synthase [Aspergillus affinis]KAI9039672.1 polyketide synthase [Aspergillus affinis]
MLTRALAGEPIAIIGTGCRLPGGASSPSRLWDLLKSPRVVASQAPSSRFDMNSFYHEDPSYPGTTNTKEAYYLSDDPHPFDASFFNISAAEAESIDPQQRQLLETVYESLEAAGLRLDTLQGSSTGIFCGVMSNDWGELLSVDYKNLPQYMATGAARSIIANRVSYFFDWHGPSIVVDTACSSSMVALHHAVTALQQQECSLALAAGTNLIQAPNIFVSTTKIQMLSPTGKSRMWDAEADGYARGEGVISIVLKRLRDALADGDSVECIIRATATNQDGRTMGLTMPSSVSQLQLIKDTYARAGLNPLRYEDRCQYFEAHGTGTLAGDPQEASAIHHAFFGSPTLDTAVDNSNGFLPDTPKTEGSDKRSSNQDEILLVGSIKTVIGHTEGTAGLAGVMKACLSLQNGYIVPNLLFNKLNPELEPFAQHLNLVTKLTPWPSLPPGVPRRVSVNSFGFGGSNAHAILESYGPDSSQNRITKKAIPCPITPHVPVIPFVFSAASERSLVAVLRCYIKYLNETPTVDLVNFAKSLLLHRSALKFRMSIWASSIDALRVQIEDEIDAIRTGKSVRVSTRRSPRQPQVLGVFTGQGAQWAMMGWDLIEISPEARRWLDEMQNGLDTLPAKYRPPFSIIEELSDPTAALGDSRLSQPLCTALQIVLVNFLKSIGVSFASVVGHSSGEIAAAYAAGVLTSTDAIRVAHLRGFVTSMSGAKNGQPGAMLAAGLSADKAVALCAGFDGRVTLAASNTPSLVTLSGDFDAIQSLEKMLNDGERFCRLLRVNTAYHSHHMYPCSGPYLRALEECGIKPQPAIGTDWYSSVYPGISTDVINQTSPLTAEYWNDNMVNPVMFYQAVSNALSMNDAPPDLIVEVGPHHALKGPVRQIIAELFPSAPDTPYLAPCSRNSSGLQALASVVGSIWCALGPGAVDLTSYLRLFDSTSQLPNQPNPLKGLPTYPFDHTRSYLFESRILARHLRHRGIPHPLLGTLEPESADGEWRWRHYLRQKNLEWLRGHQIQSQIVFPTTGYVVMAIEASRLLSSRALQLIKLDDFIIHQAIVFPDDEYAGVETLFRICNATVNDKTTVAKFYIHASTGDKMQMRVSGRLTVTWGESEPDILTPLNDPAASIKMASININDFYQFLSKIGYGYTGHFQGVCWLSRAKDISRGEVKNVRHPSHRFLLHPAVLDCALQTVFGALGSPGDGELYTILVPTQIKSIIVNPAVACGVAGDDTLLSDAVITNLDAHDISGDVGIFTKERSGIIQMEGIKISPLLQPHKKRLLFSELVWGPLTPESTSYPEPVGFSTEALVAERIALVYIKRAQALLTQDDRRNFDRHRSRLARWIDHILSVTETGQHSILPAKWLSTTQEEFDHLLSITSGTIMDEAANVVGPNLYRFFRGETSILEELRKDDILTRFYRHDMEMGIMNSRLGELVGQVAFRFPRMKILEIGAGTGSATHSILENIGRSYHSYTFTDISVAFFEEAKSDFSAHADRFIFSPLNIELDPTHQNFKEGAYDLVVAANCLHATRSMTETMTHVRRLLKPGGYLFMLEITNTNAIRTTFLMGGIEGWWAGEEDGRVWGPMLDIPSWEKVLRQTGFGGVDLRDGLGDPKLCLYDVIISQAVDDQIRLLREPLATPLHESLFQQANDLLIVGGSTRRTSSLVSRISDILKPRFCKIIAAPTLELLALDDASQLTVLSLVDMDRPCFKDLTRSRLQALQQLIPVTKKLLWVTSGAESECPYLGMSKGWLRSLAYERKDSLHQYLNIESPASDEVELLTTTLMRLVYTKNVNDHTLPSHVYVTEHELYFKNGTMQICRLRNEEAMNQRYLSARSYVSKKVEPTDPRSILRVAPVTEDRYELHVGERQHGPVAQERKGSVRVRALYSTVRAIPIEDSLLHLLIGEEENTGVLLVALTDRHENRIQIPTAWTCQVPDEILPEIERGQGGAFLKTLADVLLAGWLVDQSAPDSTLLVHEASLVLHNAIWNQAMGKNITPLFTTSNPASRTLNTTLLHPRTSARLLERLLPQNVSVAASFERDPVPDGIFARIEDLLPRTTIRKCLKSLYQSSPCLPPDPDDGQLNNLLRSSCAMAARLLDSKRPDELVSIDSIAGCLIHPDQVLDWRPSSSHLMAQIEPATSLIELSRTKTYLLAGMTGDLGRSLCYWMVSKGARHIVLTSRNPNIDPQWIEEMAQQGARVLSMSMDLADRESVIQVYRSIQQKRFPPIGGVVNGALSLEDHLFEETTLEVLQATFAPKVQGSLLLDELSGPNTNLEFFILFGSITGVVGNFKQTAYSIATGFQSSLIRRRRASGLVGSIVHPGLISGVGYITRKGSRWVEHVQKTTGSLLLSERDLHKLFAEAILAGHPKSNRNPEIVIGIRLINPAENPDIFWYGNTLTWDFIDYASKAASQLLGTNASDSINVLLESAKRMEEVQEIVSAALIAKVRSKFSLAADVPITPGTQLTDLGLDSLVAVDLRTWFARELAVDIPLLQIMGGASIEQLTVAAVSNLSASEFPHAHALREKGMKKIEQNGE